jgi:hypothetical protein
MDNMARLGGGDYTKEGENSNTCAIKDLGQTQGGAISGAGSQKGRGSHSTNHEPNTGYRIEESMMRRCKLKEDPRSG